MDIMSLFKKAAPKPDPSRQGGDPNAKDPLQNKKADPNALDPNDPAALNAKDKNKSPNPLDAFDGIFNNVKAGDKKEAPTFTLDPEVIKKVAESQNFAPQLTPELIRKFQEGDVETISAILNSVGRQAYSTLLQHMPSLTDKYVSQRLEHERSGLSGSVKQELTKQSLEKLASNNPILKEQLDHIGSSILAKFPDASPEFIAEKSKEYFLVVAKALSPDSFVPAKKESQGEPVVGDEGLQPEAWANWMTTGDPKGQRKEI